MQYKIQIQVSAPYSGVITRKTKLQLSLVGISFRAFNLLNSLNNIKHWIVLVANIPHHVYQHDKHI